ncbi:DEAD/DEAH box helicase [Glycomyces sp. MUSA5-2]|uniref:DEAD/DEAH box helicase n=1 Tax=Glycomyces sp. MUSA5-2 TaxID=2053002 RepID=UPI00300879DD
MAVEIIRGTNTKPASTDALIRLFAEEDEADGQLILGFPNLGGHPDDATSDALWLSPTFGPVLFDLVEGTDLGDVDRRQDDLYRLFQSRLLQNRDLVRRRELIVKPTVLTFAPGATIRGHANDEVLVADRDSLFTTIDGLERQNLSPETFTRLLSAAQNISSIRRARQTRVVDNKESRGAKLLGLESSIATLDNQQHHAVIETIDGVQRIRGLAGSGKTIILALKAAYLHGRRPTWKIAVTFYTRALKEQFRQLITTFCVEQSGVEPDWDRVHIINAWGGRGGMERTGMYKQFCDANDVEYLDFQTAGERFGKPDAFDGAVTAALTQANEPTKVYDAILVDEAQDFPPSFLRMCYRMLGPERRLVYAYDELQSLTGVGMPDAKEIFGLDAQGKALVTFENTSYDLGARRDIVLEQCYRNSRPVLVTAHALGFGTARKPRFNDKIGLVQMFDQPELWSDIGYHLVEGDFVAGRTVELERIPSTSPQFLESHSTFDDLIDFRTFKTAEEQDAWVADEIRRNLQEDELRFDDIMVISPDPFSARAYLGPLRRRLMDLGINNHMAGVDMSADVFFAPGRESITFTGINRAKGNEAGMVYVVNAQEGNNNRGNLAAVRNRLFTAITRSKAWVRVCGVGPEMDLLVEEFRRVKQDGFRLRFDYPSEQQRAHLRIVHREMSDANQARISEAEKVFTRFLDGMRSGQLYMEDLPPHLLEQFKKFYEDGQGG